MLGSIHKTLFRQQNEEEKNFSGGLLGSIQNIFWSGKTGRKRILSGGLLGSFTRFFWSEKKEKKKLFSREACWACWAPFTRVEAAISSGWKASLQQACLLLFFFKSHDKRECRKVCHSKWVACILVCKPFSMNMGTWLKACLKKAKTAHFSRFYGWVGFFRLSFSQDLEIVILVALKSTDQAPPNYQD